MTTWIRLSDKFRIQPGEDQAADSSLGEMNISYELGCKAMLKNGFSGSEELGKKVKVYVIKHLPLVCYCLLG